MDAPVLVLQIGNRMGDCGPVWRGRNRRDCGGPLAMAGVSGGPGLPGLRGPNAVWYSLPGFVRSAMRSGHSPLSRSFAAKDRSSIQNNSVWPRQGSLPLAITSWATQAISGWKTRSST